MERSGIRCWRAVPAMTPRTAGIERITPVS
jgi:hypothetical protein